MMMHAPLRVVIAGLIFLATATANAEDPADRQARSKAIWAEAVNRYQLGRFSEAVVLFEKAYEVHPDPDILFGLCQAHRQDKNYERAVFYCKAYLRDRPTAGNRSDVEDLIVEMEATIERQKATADKPPAGALPGSDLPATNRRSPYRAWKWAAFGAGVAAAGTGVAMILLDGPRVEDGHRLPERNDTKTIGIALAVGGAGLIATGIVLWILDVRWSPGPRLEVSSDGSSLGVVVTGAF